MGEEFTFPQTEQFCATKYDSHLDDPAWRLIKTRSLELTYDNQ